MAQCCTSYKTSFRWYLAEASSPLHQRYPVNALHSDSFSPVIFITIEHSFFSYVYYVCDTYICVYIECQICLSTVCVVMQICVNVYVCAYICE